MITQALGGQSAGIAVAPRGNQSEGNRLRRGARGVAPEAARAAPPRRSERVADARAFSYYAGRTLFGVFVREVPRGLTLVPIRFAARII